MGSDTGCGDSQDTSVRCDVSESTQRKEEDCYRYPPVEAPKASPPILTPVSCDGQPAVAVTDQIRAVAKERLRSRLGTVTAEEMVALEDGLRQVMQLG